MSMYIPGIQRQGLFQKPGFFRETGFLWARLFQSMLGYRKRNCRRFCATQENVAQSDCHRGRVGRSDSRTQRTVQQPVVRRPIVEHERPVGLGHEVAGGLPPARLADVQPRTLRDVGTGMHAVGDVRAVAADVGGDVANVTAFQGGSLLRARS